MRQVTALCRDREMANDAIDGLVEAHFTGDDISVLVVDRESVEEVEVEQRTAIPFTLPIGAAAGGAVGVALALTSVIPGLGILAAGPILGALQGLAAGTAAGSFLGTLAGLGWWKTEADIPATDLERGGILVGISVPDEREGQATEALRRTGCDRITVA